MGYQHLYFLFFLFLWPGGQKSCFGGVARVVVVAGAVVVVGAERVPVPLPVCASASPKDPATNAADKVDMMNLLMSDLLPPVFIACALNFG